MSHINEQNATEPCYVKGYPSLAAFIASDTDKSTHIYRRFDRLCARNLLYLQAELSKLEARQDKFDAEELSATIEQKRYTRNWDALQQKAAEVENTRERDRVAVAMEIREKIQQYQEAIELESFLISMDSPAPRVLEAFRNEFHNIKHPAGSYPTLGGHGKTILDDKNNLMTLRKHFEEDQLTKFLRSYLAWLFVVRKTDSPLTCISELRIRTTVAIITVIMAAGLLFGAILNLCYVASERKRLRLVAGYTVIFAVCVGLVMTARRAEVFAACAAYAAVLVVFISGNLGTAGICETSPQIGAV